MSHAERRNLGSIKKRFLIATLVGLLIFFGVISFVLVEAFRQSSEEALRERLLSEIYGLLAAADVTAEGQIRFPDQFPQIRFLQSGSGLVGEVFSASGESLWRSASMDLLVFPSPTPLATGKSSFSHPVVGGVSWHRVSLKVSWEQGAGRFLSLQFSVAENASQLMAEVHEFRMMVFMWLTAVALLLLIIEGLVMNWGLRPLGKAAREIAEVKAGTRAKLSGAYPVEMSSLTKNLNSLLAQQSSHLERYRNALADAAHSIKTPLAALRNALAGDSENVQQLDAVDRMVEYHMKKAATAGPRALQTPLLVEPLALQLVNSLKKVYASKMLEFKVNIEADSRFPGDEGDFLELLGNLLDNGCKWANKWVSCWVRTEWEAGQPILAMDVGDDGQGVNPELRELILQRGVHLDPLATGDGIGLAVVQGILDFYQGSIKIGEIAQSSKTGALFRVRIPLL